MRQVSATKSDHTQSSDSEYLRLSEHGRCSLGPEEDMYLRYKCCYVPRLAPVLVTLCRTKGGKEPWTRVTSSTQV